VLLWIRPGYPRCADAARRSTLSVEDVRLAQDVELALLSPVCVCAMQKRP
jgi:hypothetical protein